MMSPCFWNRTITEQPQAYSYRTWPQPSSVHREVSQGQPWQQAGRQTGTATVQQVSGLMGLRTVSKVACSQQPFAH